MSIAADSPHHFVLRDGEDLEQSVAPKDIDRYPGIGFTNQPLKSLHRSDLAADSYTIDVRQYVAKNADGTGPLDFKTSEKKFNVNTPQYFLPPGSVNSVYPPDGHLASNVTLPHVVLNDAQLPWERVGSEHELNDTDPNVLRKVRTPWLAVLVFTHDEIAPPEDALSKFNDMMRLDAPIQVSPTSAINVNISELTTKMYGNITFSTPLKFNEQIDDPDTTRGDVVFLHKDLLQILLKTYDANGNESPTQNRHDVSRYKWMAHVRHVYTSGMVEAGATVDQPGECESMLSVMLSHRTGPLNIEQPIPLIAHLVSIEGLEGMAYPFKADYIILSSLHSWTYSSLPPSSITDRHAFQTVENNRSLLRTPVTKQVLDALEAQGKPGKNIADRLWEGYSLAKNCTQTGDMTTALYRGPLTPSIVPYPLQSE